jgi:Heterokaryon incompatibility protein (HET)
VLKSCRFLDYRAVLICTDVSLRSTNEDRSQRNTMDHLPKPLNEEHVCVPLYADQRIYTPDEFFSFAAKYACKNTLKLIEQGLPTTMSTETANELLQSWLFFGLLAAVTGKDVNIDHFRSTDLNGRPRVNTERLNEFLESWIQREQDSNTDGDSEGQTLRFIRATHALNDARKFVYKHCSYQSFDRDNYLDYENGDSNSSTELMVGPAVDTVMTLSLAILGETLQREQPKIAVSLENRKRFWDPPNDLPKTWGHSKYLRDKLVDAKWCRRDVRRLELTMRDVSGVYFASSLKTPSDEDSHASCTFWVCRVSTREVQRHQNGSECSCRVIPANEEEIERIVRAGNTPLVQYNAAGQLTVVELDWRKAELLKFGALSHSWAEGLVHDSQNRRGMRRCKLERLQRTFNRIAETRGAYNIPFWVDELCLPRLNSLKGISINQIKDIYGKAFTVLVWDAGLLETKLGNDLIEANVRISTGRWAQRLWTLQEGILAQDLRFEFRDGELVTTWDLEERRDQARDDLWDSHHHVWQAGHPFSHAMWSLRKREAKYQVQQVWKAVQFRSSTYSSDETICLANLLDMDVQDILKITSTGDDEALSAKRMVKFLNLLEEDVRLGIPSGIIFLPAPKLQVADYTWAPASWMTEQAHSLPLHGDLRRVAQMTRLGLSVEFPGILLYPPKSAVKDKLWIPVSLNLHKWYKVVPNTRGQNWQDIWRRACAAEQPCIILSCYEPRGEYEMGVLVATKGKLSKDEARWVKILCRVWVRLETNHSVIGRLCANFRENMDNMLWGERLQHDQKWCVEGDISEISGRVSISEGAE